MSLFSERYGYKPSDVIIRERITPEIINAICSCYDRLQYSGIVYCDLQNYLWTEFLHNRLCFFNNNDQIATDFLEDQNNPWNRKLDLLEVSIKFLKFAKAHQELQSFVELLNFEFEQLHFAYRVVNDEIVEITSENEIKVIENAIQKSSDNVKMHLAKALQLFGKKPQGDYSGSIKESITAVEAECRIYGDGNTLGKALCDLKKKKVLPNTLYKAFEDLYGYTNDKSTGIRHALMDTTGNYIPSFAEAMFMLVSCSAFVNYLEIKKTETKMK